MASKEEIRKAKRREADKRRRKIKRQEGKGKPYIYRTEKEIRNVNINSLSDIELEGYYKSGLRLAKTKKKAIDKADGVVPTLNIIENESGALETWGKNVDKNLMKLRLAKLKNLFQPSSHFNVKEAKKYAKDYPRSVWDILTKFKVEYPEMFSRWSSEFGVDSIRASITSRFPKSEWENKTALEMASELEKQAIKITSSLRRRKSRIAQRENPFNFFR